MINYQNTVKIKYGIFTTLKVLSKWIKYNHVFFIFTVFLGLFFSGISTFIFDTDSSLLIYFIKSLIDNIVLAGIIVYAYIKYSNIAYKLRLESYIKIFLSCILFLIYNLIITLLIKLSENSILSKILPYIGLFIVTLCLIDIIKNNNITGIRFGFKILFNNKLFFIKLNLFAFFLHFISILLLSIILSSFQNEFKMKIFILLGIIIKIILSYVIIIFITEKNIYNEWLYGADGRAARHP
jgi:hypothetical protein